jgi:hypothetical protein
MVGCPEVIHFHPLGDTLEARTLVGRRSLRIFEVAGFGSSFFCPYFLT